MLPGKQCEEKERSKVFHRSSTAVGNSSEHQGMGHFTNGIKSAMTIRLPADTSPSHKEETAVGIRWDYCPRHHRAHTLGPLLKRPKVLFNKAKKQNHSLRVQESRLWSLQESTWKNCMDCNPGEKRGLGELVDLQESPPPNTRTAHPDKQDMKQRQQEACMGKHGAPDTT